MPLYFAFGSNMDTDQMARRCPGARVSGRALLSEHRLVFRGPSKKRGGGVLSVDTNPSTTVEGLLYEVSEAHLDALDRFEGAPEWYKRVTRMVTSLDGATLKEAVIYRLPESVREMPPTTAYVAQVSAAFATLNLDHAALDDAVTRAKEAR